MKAEQAEIGKKYLSKKGTPVTVLRLKGDQIILKVAGSDNEVPVAKSYELKPYKADEVSKDARMLINANGKSKGRPKSGEGSVASFIDPYLFAGGKTVREIAELVTKQAGPVAKGKDMEANVRARMVTYHRKGWKIERDDKKQVKVVDSKS